MKTNEAKYTTMRHSDDNAVAKRYKEIASYDGILNGQKLTRKITKREKIASKRHLQVMFGYRNKNERTIDET